MVFLPYGWEDAIVAKFIKNFQECIFVCIIEIFNGSITNLVGAGCGFGFNLMESVVELSSCKWSVIFTCIDFVFN